MQLYQLQFASFFVGTTQLDYEQLATSVRKNSKTTFSSPATYLPLPPIAPAELPRVQLQTPDSSARLSIAGNRADYFVSSPTSHLTIGQIDDFFVEALAISKTFLNSTQIVRLGLVAHMYKSSENPADAISSAMLKQGLPKLEEASVKVVIRREENNLIYNDGYQFDPGLQLDTQSKIMVVTRDINTPPETRIEVDESIIGKFLKIAREKLDAKYITEIAGA